MFCKRIPVGQMKNNIYLIADEHTKTGAVIDAGFEHEKVLQYAAKKEIEIKAICLTHVHYDHSGEADQIAQKNGAPIYAHPKIEKKRFQTPENGFWVIPEKYESVKAGDTITIGSFHILVHETPGHQSDHLTFEAENHIFTGDTLFIESVGRTDLPDSDPTVQEKTLKHIATWDDHLIVCPGHDYGSVPTRKLGEEKKLNPYLAKYAGTKKKNTKIEKRGFPPL